MDRGVLQRAASAVAERYLRRYSHVVKGHGRQPLAASALYVPGLRDAPFVGVSQWFARHLDAAVMDSLNGMGKLTPHHGCCAEPVSLSKALRHSGGDKGALRGGLCTAIRIDLTGGSFNASTDTFAHRLSFGNYKPACDSCLALFSDFGIIEI
mgnify:CR=1 FL=1|jgi:hypothetical protein